MYTANYPFQASGNFIYNLRQDGWKKGEPNLVNDVAVQINAHHLSEEQRAKITEVITNALNEAFPVEDDN